MRTPLNTLRDSHPGLADRLLFIWSKLDAEESSLAFEQRMRLVNEFEELVAQVR